ncbi:MAG: VCBS repeat-containing protein [Planctomycetota bacterium]
MGLFFLAGCNPSGKPVDTVDQKNRFSEPPSHYSPTEQTIFETNLAEDLILELSPRLSTFKSHLKKAEVNLTDLFTEQVQYNGPESWSGNDWKSEPRRHSLMSIRSVPLTETKTVPPEAIWKNVVDAGKLINPKFGVLSGNLDRDQQKFELETIFESSLEDSTGHYFGITSKQKITWIADAENAWKISRWDQKSFEVIDSPRKLFKDVTEKLVFDPKLLETLSESTHEKIILKRFTNTDKIRNANRFFPHFNDWESGYQYPAVSIIDYDNDGWDDVFVMDRWGPSILLRNEKGKRFVDVTESSGLVVKEYANCALFVDFDNDGDSDVFVGRTIKPSLYFRNDGGKFVADEGNNKVLESVNFVAAGSVADINRDGLLDLYLSTYTSTHGKREEWVSMVVRENDIFNLNRVIDQQNPFLNRGGPPNIILMNRNGKLERPEIEDVAEQWKNSYQSVWYDMDRDGDQDLYICNDFSPDVFLRNETAQGSFEPKFTDMTSEVFPDGNMGFGMGAHFGDYNRDGLIDLYVSNMYSKAGNRIVDKVGGDVDPRIAVAAKGNFLYRQTEDRKFKQVAGLDKNAQHVSKVGWSFGGQWTDLDNDGNLDLYVPSGFFTPPEKLKSTVDL